MVLIGFIYFILGVLDIKGKVYSTFYAIKAYHIGLSVLLLVIIY